MFVGFGLNDPKLGKYDTFLGVSKFLSTSAIDNTGQQQKYNFSVTRKTLLIRVADSESSIHSFLSHQNFAVMPVWRLFLILKFLKLFFFI